MREQMNTALSSMAELQPQGDTPSLGEVREKIEKRYATALGQSELASSGVEARMLEVRKATMNAAAIEPAGADPGRAAGWFAGPALTKGGNAGQLGRAPVRRSGQATPALRSGRQHRVRRAGSGRTAQPSHG